MFEGEFSENLQALCSLAQNSKCYSYGLSNVIYFQPASTISLSALSFSLNNVINSAYSFQYVDVSFRVATIVNGKVDAEATATLTKFSKPSPNVTALITNIDEKSGGEAGITYYLQFSLNSNLPSNGMISLTFPPIYENLYNIKSECVLLGELALTSAKCSIINSYLVLIYANGHLLNPSAAYKLQFTNITNPNMNLDN